MYQIRFNFFFEKFNSRLKKKYGAQTLFRYALTWNSTDKPRDKRNKKTIKIHSHTFLN